MEKNQEPTDMQTALDCAIRKSERKEGGYTMEKSGITYYNYMKIAEWNKYLENMSPTHKTQYNCGGGGELYPGKYPPKMASFGSSSRFIYELSKDISGFKFEEKLDTKVGGVANLDGFIKNEDEYIYIEAKRREIYGASHANEKIKVVYEDVYKKIRDAVKDFNFEMSGEEDDEGYKKCTFTIKDEVKYFDLKQLICHFLGITYDIAKHNIKNAKVKFIYLIYNPNEVEKEIDEKYKGRIEGRYKEVTEFIDGKKEIINCIFNAVLGYQIQTHYLPKTGIEFEFVLADQNDYKDKLNKKLSGVV